MATSTLESKPSLLSRPLAEALALDWEKVAYLVLILGAFVTRFYDLGTRAMSHDESLHTQYAWYLYEGRGFQHSPLMHGPLKFELTAFTYWLLGDNDFTARIPTALMGVAAVGLFYYFRKWLGRAGALAGAVMMLISPYMLYYARYIRDEPYVITWGMLVALCVINYMETRAAKYLYWLAGISALFYATMEASFIYIAITMLFLGLHVVRELFAVSWPNREDRRYFQIAFAVTLAAIVIALASLALSRASGEASGTATAAPADPNAPLSTATTGSPLSGVMLLAMVVAGGGLLAGTFFVFRAFGEELRRFPVLDVLMVLGLFVLPQLTAFPVRALGRNPVNYTLPTTTDIGQILNSDAGVTAIVCVILLAVSGVIGWLWDWKKFLICAAIFYGLYIPTFTTFFTNGGGIATGIVGSLGYWLEQHGVQRGGQPLYYYVLINLPVYEFLPTIGALFAAGLGVWKWWQGRKPAITDSTEAAEPISPSDTLGFPVIGYFGFWSVMAIIGFSWAGEKMPWLTTHMALPLILLAAWGIGQLIDSIDWQKFREQRGLLLVAVLPLTVVAVLMTIGTLLGANPPAQGSELPQQQATLAFGSALVVSLMGIAGTYYLGRDLGWGNVTRLAGLSFFGLLALVTARAAFIAAYVNYDDANEYLVYAHGGRGVKTMMAQIEDISMRTTGGLGLKVAYDDKWSWPGSWYLRDYPNQAYYGVQPTREQLDAPVVIAAPEHYDKVERLLKDNYYEFEYLRMVWPMQDYFGWKNPADGIPLAPGDCHAPTENMSAERQALCDGIKGGLWSNGKYRQALWNIWWDRDYTLYGELTNQTYDLSNWPVTDKVKLYVRKDVAAQIWSYGVGPSVLTDTVVAEYPPDKRQVVVADTWGRVGSDQSQFRKPRGVAVGPDGSVYVADSNNHRIQKFDVDGNFVSAWGGKGLVDEGTGDPGKFNEPWGVAVGSDGSVYVTDTWNHRVQKFDADGNFVAMWGRFGNDEAPEAFWGPRGIAVGPDGHVYVADTGNKRIAVFDATGASLDLIGSGGYDPGQFDEPVGLGFASTGILYVADNWNQRIQMFTPNTVGEYIFAKEWEILGWADEGFENKPFLALDAQGRVYVTDPDYYRVLVFDATGNFLTMWGDYGFDATTFNLPMGIALGPSGEVYVADAGSEEDGNQRVLKFPPLP